MSKLKKAEGVCTFDNLEFQVHTVLPGGKQAKIEFPNGTNASVIAGFGTYGDGDTTFEVFYSDEEEPRGYQTREDINMEFINRSMVWVDVSKGGPKT